LFACFRKRAWACCDGYAMSACYGGAYAPAVFGSALGMSYAPVVSAQSPIISGQTLTVPSKQWGSTAVQSAAPMGAAPMGAAPMGTAPTGTAPTGATPEGATAPAPPRPVIPGTDLPVPAPPVPATPTPRPPAST
jgi:hypothetical protein